MDHYSKEKEKEKEILIDNLKFYNVIEREEITRTQPKAPGEENG